MTDGNPTTKERLATLEAEMSHVQGRSPKERLALMEADIAYLKEGWEEIVTTLKTIALSGGLTGKQKAAVYIAFFTSFFTAAALAIQVWWG